MIIRAEAYFPHKIKEQSLLRLLIENKRCYIPAVDNTFLFTSNCYINRSILVQQFTGPIILIE